MKKSDVKVRLAIKGEEETLTIKLNAPFFVKKVKKDFVAEVVWYFAFLCRESKTPQDMKLLKKVRSYARAVLADPKRFNIIVKTYIEQEFMFSFQRADDAVQVASLCIQGDNEFFAKTFVKDDLKKIIEEHDVVHIKLGKSKR